MTRHLIPSLSKGLFPLKNKWPSWPPPPPPPVSTGKVDSSSQSSTQSSSQSSSSSSLDDLPGKIGTSEVVVPNSNVSSPKVLESKTGAVQFPNSQELELVLPQNSMASTSTLPTSPIPKVESQVIALALKGKPHVLAHPPNSQALAITQMLLPKPKQTKRKRGQSKSKAKAKIRKISEDSEISESLQSKLPAVSPTPKPLPLLTPPPSPTIVIQKKSQ